MTNHVRGRINPANQRPSLTNHTRLPVIRAGRVATQHNTSAHRSVVIMTDDWWELGHVTQYDWLIRGHVTGNEV